MGRVKVVADKLGNIIGPSPNNPEYGYIRVEQQTIQINHEGWLKSVKRSALIKGKMEDLEEAGYQDGTELPGKIIVVESLVPFNPENPGKHLKIAGSAGVICRVDDQPIYRESFYTSNPKAHDELISHTNSDEIKNVMSIQALSNLDIHELANEATL